MERFREPREQQIAERAGHVAHDAIGRSEALLGLALSVVSAGDEDAMAVEIARAARRLLGARTCVLYLDASDGMRVAAIDGVAPRNERRLLRGAGANSTGTTRTSRAGQLLVRVPGPEAERLGVLALLDQSWRRYTPEEESLSEAFAAFSGMALYQERRLRRERSLSRELGKSVGQQSTLASLGQRALNGTDRDELSSQIVDAVANLVPVGFAAFYRTIEPGGLALVAAAGIAHQVLPARARQDDWPEARRALRGDPAPLSTEGDSLVLAVRGDDRAHGVLAVGGGADGIPDTVDYDFIRSLAGVLGAALDARQMQDALAHQALHDPLTGLPNRTLLLDRLARAAARAEREKRGLAVLFIDLDDFKTVNDDLGHRTGDLLLQEIAARLQRNLRPTDTASRLGGDEFVVVSEVADEAAAEALAVRLLDTVRRPIPAGEGGVTVTASVGVALGDPGSTEPERLLRDADAAMYQAKQRGGASHVLSSSGVPPRVTRP